MPRWAEALDGALLVIDNAEHLIEGLRAGADAVLAASIFHYGTHTIPEVKAAISASGFAMRA